MLSNKIITLMKRTIILAVLFLLPLTILAQNPRYHAGARTISRTVTLESNDKIFETSGNTIAFAVGVVGKFMKLTGELALPGDVEGDDVKFSESTYSAHLDFFKNIDLLLPFIGIKYEYVDIEFDSSDASIAGSVIGINGGASLLFPDFLVDFYYSTNLQTLEDDNIKYDNETQVRLGLSFVF